MAKVSSVKHQETKKTEVKKEQNVQQKTTPKSADVNSTNPSERAKQIQSDGKIQEGVYKDEHSSATVGDIAQANAMKEDGTVDPEAVQQQVKDIISNNPVLADQAKELGIDLENPTADDLQKLANLEVKAGQEVKVGEKPVEEAKAPEEAKAEEAVPEEAKPEEAAPEQAQEAAPAEQAQEAKQPESPLGQILELIEQAEQTQDPAQKRQLADQAIQMINSLRAEKGITKGEGQNPAQQNATAVGQNPQNQQLVQNIQSGAQIDKAALAQVVEGGDKALLAQVLDALEQRANLAKNGNNNMLNALNMFGQNNLANMGIGSIKLPYMNQAIA